MLQIKKIKFKNLLSSGNTFTEIDFDTTKTTLLRGANGNGKSLVITALVFGLYGKSNRGTTKKQLVNSINRKDCLVEVYFSTEGREYKIVRGITPNRFEIWIDGKLQEELAAVKDQQNYLEQNILKISYKTFMQVVVLGSNNFTPFMQLSASDRRDLVEELLDIKVFSVMNIILREKLKGFDRTLQETVLKKSSILEKIEMQKHFIETIHTNGSDTILKKKERIKEIEGKTDELNNLIELIQSEIKDYSKQIEELSDETTPLNKLISIEGKIEQKKMSVEEELNFFETNTSCPTCKSSLSEEFRLDRSNELRVTHHKLTSGLEELTLKIKEQQERESSFNQLCKIINEKNHQVISYENEIHRNNKNIIEIEKEVLDIENSLKNQEYESKVLKDLMKEQRRLTKIEGQCKTALEYFKFASILMKDDGIKSKIIEQYLPVINQQINQYLQLMDLYVNFSLNSEFKESVNTPIHEDFSYGSFSEGEKQKLNLAILFCWRDIAKMKNSVNCNLLFLDETFDSSLDSEGAECLLKIINYVLKDVNVFVISHRIDDFTDKFERVLEVKKINGFSKVFT